MRASLLLPLVLAATSSVALARLAGDGGGGSPDLTGSAFDLSGRFTVRDARGRSTGELVFTHARAGIHTVRGTASLDGSAPAPLTGEARADVSETARGELGVTLSLKKGSSQQTLRFLARRDRTALVSTRATLSRQVEPGFVRLKVMTYNVKGIWMMTPGDYRAMAELLKSEKPDVLMLQEIHNVLSLDQADALAKLMGYKSTFAAARTSWGKGEGVALLWREGGDGLRAKLERRHVEKLPKSSSDKDLQRNALVGDFSFPSIGRKLRVVNTHLSHNTASSRRQQTPIVGRLAREGATPAILGGDLNANPDAPEIRLLTENLGLVDVCARAHPERPTHTFPVRSSAHRLDYILISRDPGRSDGGVKVLNAWIRGGAEDEFLSDHLAIAAMVELALDR